MFCAVALLAVVVWVALHMHYQSPIESVPANVEPSRPPFPGTPPRSDVYRRMAKLRATLLKRAVLEEKQKAESMDIFHQGRESADPVRRRKLMKEALRIDPDNQAALSTLAWMDLDDGDPENARALATECLAVDERNSECHTVLVASYTRFGKFDDAYLYLADCLDTNPKNINCLGGLVSYHLSKKDFATAASVVERMRVVDPNSMWTALHDADVQLAMGNRDAALVGFRRACDAGQSYACGRIQALSPQPPPAAGSN